jgi:predicted N-acetyltransferase YhbS
MNSKMEPDMANATDKAAQAGLIFRPLAAQDLERVVAIDAALSGDRPRRGYFERRLHAAIKAPHLHLQFACEHDGALVGYVLSRRMFGEFGRESEALRLAVIGVLPGEQHHGVGLGLLHCLEDWCRRHGLREIRSQAHWKHHRILEFFDHAGFELGRNHVIDCEVHSGPLVAAGGSDEPFDADEGREVDYSDPAANDYEALPRDRVDVRILQREDAPALARIDSKNTGRDRSAYLAELVDEALDESAVRVSLVARVDGIVRGFVMAKADFGDFGRTEPVAVIDTIDVDPDTARQGIGSALLSQLFVNLQALQVARAETVVSRENLGVLAFLYRCGFAPSERLGFVRRVV